MKVKKIMSSPVETVDSRSKISEAAEKMKSFDVGVLPVMREDEITGIITDRDIIVRILAEGMDPKKTSVSKAMTEEAASCSEDTDIEEAVRIMEEKKVHRLLVLDENDEVSGILSISDIARKMKDEHLLHELLERICQPV